MSQKDLNKIIFCIVGPSGSGKSTLTKYLLENYPDLFQKFFTVTDRSMRSYEKQYDPYFFITPKEFDEKIKNQDFLEYENQQHNNCRYGKSKSVLNSLKENKILITELQIYKMNEFKNSLPQYKIYSLFLHVEDIEDMKDRLLKRGDSKDTVEKRIESMIEEGNKNMKTADFIIPSIEGNIKRSADKIIDIIGNELKIKP